jgi:hypothetical protein
MMGTMNQARLVILVCVAEIAGCATIMHGTTQRVRIESTPAGARASVGSQTVTTPGEITLPRDGIYIVNFDKAGYVPTYAHIEETTSGFVWGNIALGGFMGAAIDYANGAAYDLEPATVSATLAPNPAAVAPGTLAEPPPAVPPAQQP